MTYVLRAGVRTFLHRLEYDMIEAVPSLTEAAKFTKEQAEEMVSRCGRSWWIEAYDESNY